MIRSKCNNNNNKNHALNENNTLEVEEEIRCREVVKTEQILCRRVRTTLFYFPY